MSGDDLPKFTDNGIKQLAEDINSLEQFMQKIKKGADYFAEMKQIIQLLLSEHPEEFLDPTKKKQLYPNIQNHATLLRIIDK